MTYDSADIIKSFHTNNSLSYPFLRDEDAKHVNAFGILNDAYTPADPGYGIPHPGIILFDHEGTVVAKLAEPGFKQRPSFAALYAAVNAAINE